MINRCVTVTLLIVTKLLSNVLKLDGSCCRLAGISMALSIFSLLWQLLQACNEMSFVIVIEKGDCRGNGMQIAYFKIERIFFDFSPGREPLRPNKEVI